MDNNYIFKTNYFKDPWTWVKRLMEFIVAAAFLYWVYLQESDQVTDYSWIKYLLFGLLTIFIFVRPKDDLALDNHNLYYIKKSLIPLLSKTKVYKISDIESIGCGGVLDINTEIFGLLGSGTNRNRLEIIFKDNSSKAHDMTVYKYDLLNIISKVNGLINKTDK